MKENRESLDRLYAILLAAGPSSRLGQPKQLVRIAGESLVRRSVRLLLEAGITHVVVVTGYAPEAVENQLKKLPVTLCHNPDWERGMGNSIACGARNIAADSTGVMIMLCDQWRIEKEDILRLISCWLSDISNICSASWYLNKSIVYGPPVIFPRKLIREIRYLDNFHGAKQLIDRNHDCTELVPMKNACFDLDRPEDLELLKEYSTSSGSGFAGPE